ncbi:MAG: PhoD-like phosphatase N-terminal domain-containing protein [Bacteroidota bacterium]
MNTLRLFVLMIVAAAVSLPSQDMRNDMFGVRRAGHEPRVSKRSDVTQVEDRLRPFYHGVASGDPLSDRVIIWTRVSPQNGEESIDVRWLVATDPKLTTVILDGMAAAR